MDHSRMFSNVLITLMNFAAAVVLSVCAMPSSAQYPAKPMRLIVPVPAGGPSDSMARVVAEALSQSMGQAMVVENRPGANGSIAAQAVLAAPADGYTLLWGLAAMNANPLLQKNAPYHSLSEFAPICIVGRFVFGLFVHPDIPARTIDDLVAYARASPDRLTFASNTLREYLAIARLMQAADIRMLRVPYKGGSQAMPDLVTGRVQVAITPVSLGLPYAREGKLRLLGTLSARRTAITPDVATLAEAGYPTVSLPGWQALFGPPGMSRDIGERVSGEVRAAIEDARVRARFEQALLEPDGSTPEQLSKAIAEDAEAWRRFIRDHGIPRE